ncbi:MAG: response regulator [Nitrospirae bacterium]|nr:response regulator [Nitrospirota bacterium]
MKKVIMIIDDSASVRQLVNMTLANAGHEVVEAVDGSDALDKLKGVKADMMFVDVNMPKIDGLEFIKQARIMPNCRFIPIIMLTTEAHVSKRHEGKLAGATGWIIKPFKPEQLLTIVNKFLG